MDEHPTAGIAAAKPRKSKVVPRSIYIILLVLVGFLFLGGWAVTRVALCSGDHYGVFAFCLCNLHWVTVLALLAAAYVFGHLVRELSETELSELEAEGLIPSEDSKIRTKRGLWHRIVLAHRAYRKLPRKEFIHTTTVLVIAVLLLIFFFWLFLLSPVVFF